MTSGNPILDKNLECIEKYNPELKEKLLNLPYLTNSIELVETELQEPNLTYNDLPLHSQNGAEFEAKELFEKAESQGADINIVFGIGLGYLFKEFCENSLRPIILYEPNLEILRVTLELVDFSIELSKKNVRVSSDFQELKQGFEAVYTYKSEINFLFLKSYQQIHSEEIKSTLRQVEILKGTCVEQLNLIGAKGLDFISSVLENLPRSLEATPLMELKDVYKEKTAIIVSAGPTLDSSIELIKENRDKVVIFCVGTAFKVLANNEITPDFLNILEVVDCSGQVKGFDLSEINLIMEPFINKSFQTMNVKQKFLFPSKLTIGSQYWAHLTNMDISAYSSAGSVSFEALNCAKMLGFSKIILVGQDLAYVNNRCFSSMGSYSDMVYEINPQTNRPEFKVLDRKNFLESCSSVDSNFTQEQIEKFADEKLKTYNDTTCFVRGITGKMVPTLSAYAMFVDLFREFAHYNQNLELINTSMIGAQIDGFKNIPLSNALENLNPIEPVDLSSKFEFDKNQIFKNLCEDLELIKNALKDFEKTKEYLFKLDREFQRGHAQTKETSKFINILLQIYDDVTVKYFEKNHLYRTISMIESLELKRCAESKIDNPEIKIKKLHDFLKIYFVSVENKLMRLAEEIYQQIETLRDNIGSEAISAK